jgi:hypothetical protein
VETAVAYECHAPSHRSGEGGGPDKLTVHDGEWAFCAFDARADGHVWERSPGLTMSMIRRSASPHERDPVK